LLNTALSIILEDWCLCCPI